MSSHFKNPVANVIFVFFLDNSNCYAPPKNI
jgi:hypothetical protein